MADLVAGYDLVMLDLDGVVYVGPDPVPYAAETLSALVERGVRCAYVTNNASRAPGSVAEHLRELGVPAQDEDVVTSSQAAAHMLLDVVGEGAQVFVIGGEGLEVALAERGLGVTRDPDAHPQAVVSGYHPELRWRTVIDGAILVRNGVPWVATNTDMTVPTPRGPGPGNGVLVGAVARYAGVEPLVAGKPEPPLLRETVDRCGGEHPLMVGDRLDTDVAGALRVGCDSLLVMTGVTGLEELVAADPEHRPTYLGADLRALLESHPPVVERDRAHVVGGWSAAVERGRLLVRGEGDPSDWWRAATAAAWAHLDAEGAPAQADGLTPPG